MSHLYVAPTCRPTASPALSALRRASPVVILIPGITSPAITWGFAERLAEKYDTHNALTCVKWPYRQRPDLAYDAVPPRTSRLRFAIGKLRPVSVIQWGRALPYALPRSIRQGCDGWC